MRMLLRLKKYLTRRLTTERARLAEATEVVATSEGVSEEVTKKCGPRGVIVWG